MNAKNNIYFLCRKITFLLIMTLKKLILDNSSYFLFKYLM